MKTSGRMCIGMALAVAWLLAGCVGIFGRGQSTPSGFLVRPYLQNAGKTEMTIRWIAPTQGPYVVRCETAEGPKLETVPDAPQEVGWADKAPTNAPPGFKPAEYRYYLYAARLTNLTAGTVYRYAVNLGGETTGGVFRTIPERIDKFSFIAYGDNRSNPEGHTRLASCFPAHRPAFILNSGDLVSSGAPLEWKPEFFDPLAETIAEVPIWPSIGNHDGNFHKYFTFPANRLWYSFDYGNAHFVCLQTPIGGDRAEPMRKWCEEDLAASQATWKFVFYHFPSYDNSRHRTAWGRGEFLPIFRKYGVDFVLTGHSHSYQRFKPMFTKDENEKHPVTHIVSAGGGASISPQMLLDPYLVAWANEYHYMVFSIEGDKLSARALAPDGRELDAFTVSKKDGVPDSAWLTSSVPEEEFGKLRERVAPCLRGLKFEQDPRSGKPAQVKFKLTAGAKALRYQLRLGPNLADKEFEMEPVAGSVKADEAADVVVTLRLKRPERYADPKVALATPRIECVFEIDGEKASVYSTSIKFDPATAKTEADDGDGGGM